MADETETPTPDPSPSRAERRKKKKKSADGGAEAAQTPHQQAVDLASLAVPREEEDALFKIQMVLANTVLGYWRHALAITAVVLVAGGIYGALDNHHRDSQRETQAAVARIEAGLPEIDQMARYGLAPMDDPEDAERMAQLAKAAGELEAVAADGTGTAEAMAWLSAARVWERAGRPDDAARAYEAASKLKVDDLLRWSATAGLANVRVGQGDIDGAVALYRALVTGEGPLAERALLEIGRALEAGGRPAEAREAYQDLTTRSPQSSFASEATAGLQRLPEAG